MKTMLLVTLSDAYALLRRRSVIHNHVVHREERRNRCSTLRSHNEHLM